MVDCLVWNVRCVWVASVVSTPLPGNAKSVSDKLVCFLHTRTFDAAQYRDVAMWQDFAKTEGVHTACYRQSFAFICPKPRLCPSYVAVPLAHRRCGVELGAAFAHGGKTFLNYGRRFVATLEGDELKSLVDLKPLLASSGPAPAATMYFFTLVDGVVGVLRKLGAL